MPPKARRGRPPKLSRIEEVERRYESNIHRPSVSGACHPWIGEVSSLTKETPFWNEEGIAVQSHIWKYEYDHGPLPKKTILWRCCGNVLCHNEEHWVVDKKLNKKQISEILSKKYNKNYTIRNLATEYNVSISLVRLITEFKEPL